MPMQLFLGVFRTINTYDIHENFDVLTSFMLVALYTCTSVHIQTLYVYVYNNIHVCDPFFMGFHLKPNI